MKTIIIDNAEDLKSFIETLKEKDVKEIGLDFEGESNLHRYGLHLCLIQICDGADIYLIDPIAIKDISPLKEIFEERSITKIMCACDFDVKLLKETKGIKLFNIFDVHYGAKAVGIEKLSLGNIVETYLNIELSKSRKKQKANWNVRPLKETMIEYAAADVRYLIELKEVMSAELKEKNVWSSFIEKCEKLEELELPKDKPPHLTVKGVGLLNREQRHIFKHIYYARDFVAQKLDKPVYQVIPNSELLKISKIIPKTEQEWEQLYEEHKTIKKHKVMLRKAVERGLKK